LPLFYLIYNDLINLYFFVIGQILLRTAPFSIGF